MASLNDKPSSFTTQNWIRTKMYVFLNSEQLSTQLIGFYKDRLTQFLRKLCQYSSRVQFSVRDFIISKLALA